MLGTEEEATDTALLGKIVGKALKSVLGMDVKASDGALLGRIVGEAL